MNEKLKVVKVFISMRYFKKFKTREKLEKYQEKMLLKQMKYIKENYHINSEYSEEDDILYIWSPNVNESLNLAAAKEYIQETIGDEFINVIYGMKQ